MANRDSLKSTWRTGDRGKWTIDHWLIELLNAHPQSLDTPVPVHAKTDKIPYLTQRSQHVWVMTYAVIPLLIHQACIYLQLPSLDIGRLPIDRIALFLLYFGWFTAAVVREVHILRRLGHKYGFLDGDAHERDGVPDVGVSKVVASLWKTTGSRIGLLMYLSYSGQAPLQALSSPRWWLWLSLEIGVYGVVLDFWFYWYHRAMHDVPQLWKFHRTHHLTKHPNPLLTAYADEEQEFFDMVGIPLMTYLTMKVVGFPLGFYDWWFCHQFIAYTEVWGHSGIRVHLSPPSTLHWLLQAFDANLVVEDHDLHHRKGWRKSHNYCKQTRVWDRVFGTTIDRIESRADNVDYVNTAYMPVI